MQNPYIAGGLFLLLWLAVLLPSAWVDLTLDDLLHRDLLEGVGSDWWRALFVFLTGETETTTRMVTSLGLPWWTDPAVKIAFFRPLTSATHWLDYSLWPDNAVLMHLHSILWYGIACIMALLFYRRLLSVGIAMLATALFAMDFQHLVSISWLASRNSLVAVTFALAAMLWHWHAIQQARLRLSWLAAFMMFAALLAGESGAGCAGYILGCSLFLDRRSWHQRLLALLPFAILGGIWLLYYLYHSFGTANSGFYSGFMSGDPAAALLRMPFLAALFVSGLPGQVWPQNLGGPTAVSMIAIVVLLALAIWLLRPLLRTSAIARCLLLGAIVALIPVANCVPTDRNLLMFSIGGHALLALILAQWWQDWRTDKGSTRGRSIACWSLVASHLVLSPLAYLAAGAGFIAGAANSYPLARSVAMDEGRDAIVVHAPTAILMPTILVQRDFLDLPVPKFTYVLAVGDGSVEVVQQDRFSLLVTLPPQQDKMGSRYSLIFRDFSKRPLIVGQVFSVGDASVEVLEVDAKGFPLKVMARFVWPLDTYQYLTWQAATKKFVAVDVASMWRAK